MPLNMQFLWAVPHATNKTADRILRDQVEHTVSPASAHIGGTLAVRNIILLIHNNVSLRTCPEAKGKATKDLGIDEILFTWHRRKLLQKCSLWERGILNKWIFEKGAVFYTDISYWRLFPLPWTFPSYIFSWHCDLTSLPLSPFASQPFFFFSLSPGNRCSLRLLHELPLLPSTLGSHFLLLPQLSPAHGWAPKCHDSQSQDSIVYPLIPKPKLNVFLSLLSFIHVFTLAW